MLEFHLALSLIKYDLLLRRSVSVWPLHMTIFFMDGQVGDIDKIRVYLPERLPGVRPDAYIIHKFRVQDTKEKSLLIDAYVYSTLDVKGRGPACHFSSTSYTTTSRAAMPAINTYVI